MAPQAACVHEGGGVERRAAHHERERQRRQREAAGGSTEPAAEEATDVEAVSAADVLAGVEESGPNYALPTAREGQRERRERLRVDETAKQAGHTIVETGTHVEILGEQGLWWPATIAGREEDVDGRLVHEVEYDGYQGEQYWHMLDDEQWRRATAMPTPADGTNVAFVPRLYRVPCPRCFLLHENGGAILASTPHTLLQRGHAHSWGHY